MTYVSLTYRDTNTHDLGLLTLAISVASLENWSKHHKTHLDILRKLIAYARELENQVSLRLFHEGMVLEPDQQYFEYIGCHDGTGMLVLRRED